MNLSISYGCRPGQSWAGLPAGWFGRKNELTFQCQAYIKLFEEIDPDILESCIHLVE